MAIGVFGGTFDPVHVGHLRVAEEVREAFSLERVYFVPASIQPLKVTAQGTGADERVRMLEMAVSSNGFFRVSVLEIKRGGISYSIDTVRHFSRRFGHIYFLVGMDAFLDIGLWKDCSELFSMTDFVVMVRPGKTFRSFPKVSGARCAGSTRRPSSMRRGGGSTFSASRSSISLPRA